MYALKHKTTGEVQFVFDKEAHDLTKWDATELTEEPTEFHRFEKGKLVLDKALRDKAVKASEANSLSREQLVDRLATIEARLEAIEAALAERDKPV